ncbi:hypothetical protein KP509_11G030400 [Ceratopteris richardii]|uniref:Pericentriolar material 1 protein n=1 Tax=Ceratopteris richardii TaxID=49495 RepID=A0A8T2TT60_CERRI|nr:hypothetical protein KP509_11G030400 [Ceratopteris richardii]
MEVWILLAAAGSGYLARRWQNTQKPKGSSADETEDEGFSESSYCEPSNRGRYQQVAPSIRRAAGKPTGNHKESSYWAKSESTGSPFKYDNQDEVEEGEDSENANRKLHTCNDAETCEICSKYQKFSPGKTSYEGSYGQLKDVDRKPNLVRESSLYMYLDSTHPQIPPQDRYGLGRYTQEEYLQGQVMEDTSYYISSKSGKRLNNNLDGKAESVYEMHQDCFVEMRIKDCVRNSSEAQSDISALESCKPGFLDVSQGDFVLDTENLHAQQDRSRGISSISRKSRTPNKYDRSKGSRRKTFVGPKSMSSLESCLSAQLHEGNIMKAKQARNHIGHDGLVHSVRKSFRHVNSLSVDGKVQFLREDFAIGLPSMSRVSSKRNPSKLSTPRFPICDISIQEEPFHPSACYMHDTFNCAKLERREGRIQFSMEGILFSFGVGVGMMFTVMSNMHEVRKLTSLLKEAESLVKDLEDELERKDGIESVGLSSNEDKLAFPSSVEHMPSKDMSKLEEELEAELERMEFNLGEGDNADFQIKSTDLSNQDGEVGSLVCGELTILGLPNEAIVETGDNSGSSSHENDHAGSYAVSPRALAKRLHEILAARQEERISELEAELESLNRKLQAKEDELRLLKGTSHGLHSGDTEARLSAVSSFQQSSPKQSCTEHFDTRGSYGGSKILHSPTVSPVSEQIPMNLRKDSAVFKKRIEDKSAAFITLGGETLAAYKEACDDFSKLGSGFDTSSIPEGKPSENFEKDRFAQDDKMQDKQYVNVDGLEQVDLFSLAEDFYGGGDSELLEGIPAHKSSERGRHGPRRKSHRGSRRGHPEPEQNLFNSRGMESSDDATNDTSGSTPCSIKFIDVRTDSLSEDRRSNNDLRGTSFFDDNWNSDIQICPRVKIRDQEELEKSSDKALAQSLQSGWNVPDDVDYYSELDEQLGQLLIKRFVEKSREGSPILQDAQAILEHLEDSEISHAVD